MALIPLEEMVGRRFGKLLVLDAAGKDKRGKALYKCKCTCGTVKVVHGYRLRNGATISCGCVWKRNKIAYFKGILKETEPDGRN